MRARSATRLTSVHSSRIIRYEMLEAGTPIDASSLIYLAKADAFRLLELCEGPIAVPPTVWDEVVDAGERRGAAEVPRVRRALESGWLRMAPLTPAARRRAGAIRRAYSLGAGESEVIASATRSGLVVLDEGRATRVAETLNLLPVPTILLPVIGRERQLLDESEALELLERLAVVSAARAEQLIHLQRRIRRHTG